MKKAVDNAKIKVGDKEAARKTEEDARIKKEQDTQQKVLKARAKHKAVMDMEVADFNRDLQEGNDLEAASLFLRIPRKQKRKNKKILKINKTKNNENMQNQKTHQK